MTDPADEKGIPVASEGEISSAEKVNLEPFLLNSGLLNKDINFENLLDLLRTSYNHAVIKEDFLKSVWKPKKGFEDIKKVHAFRYNFGKLPQFMGVHKLNPEKDEIGREYEAATWVTTCPVSPIEGWELISTLKPEQKEGGGFSTQNWMQKQDDSCLYMRFWFTQWFKRDTKEMMPSEWTARFEYLSATMKKEKSSVKNYEKALIETNLTFHEGVLKYPHDSIGFFSQWEPSEEKKAVKFVYDARECYTTDPQNEIVLQTDLKNIQIDSRALGKIKGGKDEPSSLSEIVASGMFPHFRASARKLDFGKTLVSLVEAFTKGNVDNLAGFKQIHFSRYS